MCQRLKRVRFVVGGVVCVLLGLAAASQLLVSAQEDLPAEIRAYADSILYNGKVLTADDKFTVAKAVAIRDGKILAVGEDSRILRMAGPGTRRIDLQGKCVTPGFIDTHFHLHNYAFNPKTGGAEPFPVLRVEELEGEVSREGLLRLLRKKAASWPRMEGWVLFGEAQTANKVYENHLFYRIRKQDLDAIFPNEPAALGASHGNNYSYYVMNSRGLETIFRKIGRDSAGVVKSSTGEPMGLIVRPAASAVGEEILPWPNIPRVTELLKAGIRRYNAMGTTMVQTKTPGFVMAGLRELWAKGELSIRWRAQLKGFDNVGDQLEGLLKRMGNLSGLGDDMLKLNSGPGGVSQEAWDKTWEQPRVQMKDLGPSDSEAGSGGEDRGTYLAAKYGWSIGNVHTQGDRSNDAYLKQLEEGVRDRLYPAVGQRFGLDHAQMITATSPEGNQVERIAKLGVVPSLNIGKILRSGSYEADRKLTDDEAILKMDQVRVYEAKWGRERVFQMLPARSLIKAGVKPTIESDSYRWPETYPLWTIEKQITRKDEKEGVVWGPGERVSRQEGLWMRTKWAADYTADGARVGSIEPGKLADLVVLDRDYMTVPEDDISQIRVLTTLVGGTIVYDAARDGRLETIYPLAVGHWKE